MTMPVENGKLTDCIKDKRYVDPENAWRRIKARVNTPGLDIFDPLISESLSDTNTALIELISAKLKIETQIIRDAQTSEIDRSRKLLEICVKNGATQYLSGPSGKKYLNEQIFLENGIQVLYFQGQEQSSIIEKISV
jgi:hypothetical protein